MASPFELYFNPPVSQNVTLRADADTGSIYERVCWVYSLSDYLIFWRAALLYYRTAFGFTDQQLYDIVFLPDFWQPYRHIVPDGAEMGLIDSGSGYAISHFASPGYGQTKIFSDKVNTGATAAFGDSGAIYYNDLNLDFAGGLAPVLGGPQSANLAPPEAFDSWSYVYRALSKPTFPADTGFSQMDFSLVEYQSFALPSRELFDAIISPIWPPAPAPAPPLKPYDLDLNGLKSRTPLNNFGFTFNFLKGQK